MTFTNVTVLVRRGTEKMGGMVVGGGIIMTGGVMGVVVQTGGGYVNKPNLYYTEETLSSINSV